MKILGVVFEGDLRFQIFNREAASSLFWRVLGCTLTDVVVVLPDKFLAILFDFKEVFESEILTIKPEFTSSTENEFFVDHMKILECLQERGSEGLLMALKTRKLEGALLEMERICDAKICHNKAEEELEHRLNIPNLGAVS